MKFPSILVIGANGFIGRHVTQALLDHGATDVCAGVSRLDSHAEASFPVPTVECNLLLRMTLDAAMSGKAVVINCARGPDADSPLAISNLLAAAADNAVRRLIQFSSVAVYGDANGLITEETPAAALYRGYGADKIAVEAECRNVASRDLRIAVLRPSLVYGPFGEEWILNFARRARGGQLHDLGTRGEGEANLVYVGDLARFCTALAVRNLPEFSIFNINGDQIPTFNEYFDALNRAMGLETPASRYRSRHAWEFRRKARSAARRIIDKLPKSMSANRLLARATQFLDPSPRDDPWDRFATKIAFSNSMAKLYGFDPSTTIESGISQTLEAHRQYLAEL